MRLVDPWGEGFPRFPLSDGTRSIFPDGYFELRRGGSSFQVVIETETGSRTPKDVLKKIDVQATRAWEGRHAVGSRRYAEQRDGLKAMAPSAHDDLFGDLFDELHEALTPVFDFDGFCSLLILCPTTAMAERLHRYVLKAIERARPELKGYLRLDRELAPLGVELGWFFAIASLEEAEARGPLEPINRLLAPYEGHHSASLEEIWEAYERCKIVESGRRIGDLARWFHEHAPEELLRKRQEYHDLFR